MLMESPTFSGPREHVGRTSTKIALSKSVDYKKAFSGIRLCQNIRKEMPMDHFYVTKAAIMLGGYKETKMLLEQDIPWGNLFSVSQNQFSLLTWKL